MLDMLFKRRSIRKYKDCAISKEQTDMLIQAALLSPSSRGINPWEFIVVNDKNIIEKLSKAKAHGSAFLKNAPLAIIVLADTTKSDVWVEDASIASIIVQLQAESMGLGSCWVQIRNRKSPTGTSSEMYVKELLDIPQNLAVESIIAVGVKDEIKKSYTNEQLDYTKVSYNVYKD